MKARLPLRPDGTAPPISSARLGMFLLIAAETMLFGGLIGAFLVFRFGSASWPPPGLPRLPVAVTALNTGILFASCYPMARALRAIRRNDREGLRGGVAIAALLGTTFLLIQGAEWIRLVRFGLHISSGPYGSTFYTLIGFHGLHVLAAVAWLLLILAGASRRRFSASRHTAVELASIYWAFVSAVWAVLFPLVYLGS